ncbi:MAG TPA: lysine biosynthesis protein LysW, partial [Trueperaceae bacterium]
GREVARERTVETMETEYGRVQVDGSDVMLGELFVTDEGVELEVVGLDPLRFEPAPQEEEDWGE